MKEQSPHPQCTNNVGKNPTQLCLMLKKQPQTKINTGYRSKANNVALIREGLLESSLDPALEQEHSHGQHTAFGKTDTSEALLCTCEGCAVVNSENRLSAHDDLQKGMDRDLPKHNGS